MTDRSCGVGKRCTQYVLASRCEPDPAQPCMELTRKQEAGSFLSFGSKKSQDWLTKSCAFSHPWRIHRAPKPCKSRRCVILQSIPSNIYRWGHRKEWLRKTFQRGKPGSQTAVDGRAISKEHNQGYLLPWQSRRSSQLLLGSVSSVLGTLECKRKQNKTRNQKSTPQCSPFFSFLSGSSYCAPAVPALPLSTGYVEAWKMGRWKSLVYWC